MIRLFEQHHIRKQKELNGLWDFRKTGEEKTYLIPVPGCWEQNPDLITYRGRGTYCKTVEVLQDTNLRFEFKGVSHTADVFLDGVKIAHHYNAYTAFSTVVKDVKRGSHRLTVEVDNSFSEASSLHVPNDYYTYGGLNRTVVLEEVPDAFIENIHFTPYRKNNQWAGNVKVFLRNLSPAERKVTLALSLAGTRQSADVLLPADATAVYETELWFENVEEWDVLAPHLYDITATLPDNGVITDDLVDRVGFREIAIEGRKILLNGRRVFLKGFNRHEEYGPFGCTVPFQAMVQDIDLMLEMGSNAIRTCHYPNDELFLDICDAKGIMVWEENHARGLSLERMMNPHFDRQSEDCTAEMIAQHFNHPGIVIWAIFNECASDTETGAQKYKARFDQIKALDTSRPTSAATCRHFKDLCLNMQDIVSFNMYSGWYDDGDPQLRHEKEMDWIASEVQNEKPVIISEFGAGAVYGYRDRTRCKWSEEHQEDVLRQMLELYNADDRLSGVFIWQFADVRVTEEEWWDRRPRCHNNKGVVDEYRRPKEAFDTVKEIFPKMTRE